MLKVIGLSLVSNVYFGTLSNGLLSELEISDLIYNLAMNDDVCYIQACMDLADSGTTCVKSKAAQTDSSGYDWIKLFCDDVFDFYTCDFEDLVWEADCECPSCPCTTYNETQRFLTSNFGISKKCTVCHCDYFNDANELAWDCSTAAEITYTDDDYDSFTCPYNAPDAVQCYHNATGNFWNVHDTFWTYINESNKNSNCTVGCLCQDDGELYCVQGFAGVRNDPTIWPYMFENEADYIGYCYDDVTLWSQYDSFQCGYSSWHPYCQCNGDDTVEDYYSWSLELQDNDYYNTEYYCATDCVCDPNNIDAYIDCDDIDDSYSPIDCPETTTCNNAECSDEDQNYCSTRVYDEFGFFNGKVYYGTESGVDSCEDDWLCQLVDDTNGRCVYGDVSFTAYPLDCNDSTYTSTFTEDVDYTAYLECCVGFDCESSASIIDPDHNVCDQSESLETVYNTLYECKSRASMTKSIYGRQVYCADPGDDYTVCEGVTSQLQYEEGCICIAMASVYNSADDSTQLAMQRKIDNAISAAQIANIFASCNFTMTCDLSGSDYRIDYCEYYVSFDIESTIYNKDDFDESAMESTIDNIILIGIGNIMIDDISGSDTDVKFTVTTVFANNGTASEFKKDLKNDVYDFSSIGTYTEDSIDGVNKECSNAKFEIGSASRFGYSIITFIIGMIGIFITFMV